MASESPKKRAPKKKSEEGDDGKATKKAKTLSGDKPTMADYMPKEYPAELYPAAPADCHKIVSWNVNGLNSCYGKGFPDYVGVEAPDVLALQETKIQEAKVDEWSTKMKDLGFEHQYWTCSGVRGESAKGYASTAVLTKTKPIKAFYGLIDSTMVDIAHEAMGEHNDEGRTITLEFGNYFLVNCYVPNSGQKLERLGWRETVWDAAMLVHLKTLEGKGKPVVFTGDLNVAHTAKDLANDKTNYNKTAGFCQKEIDGFQKYLNAGFLDTYRELYPDQEAYTYYGFRFNAYAKNLGWRIDYFLVSQQMKGRIADSLIRKSVYGSTDHCPIVLHLKKE